MVLGGGGPPKLRSRLGRNDGSLLPLWGRERGGDKKGTHSLHLRSPCGYVTFLWVWLEALYLPGIVLYDKSMKFSKRIAGYVCIYQCRLWRRHLVTLAVGELTCSCLWTWPLPPMALLFDSAACRLASTACFTRARTHAHTRGGRCLSS